MHKKVSESNPQESKLAQRIHWGNLGKGVLTFLGTGGLGVLWWVYNREKTGTSTAFKPLLRTSVSHFDVSPDLLYRFAIFLEQTATDKLCSELEVQELLRLIDVVCGDSKEIASRLKNPLGSSELSVHAAALRAAELRCKASLCLHYLSAMHANIKQKYEELEDKTALKSQELFCTVLDKEFKDAIGIVKHQSLVAQSNLIRLARVWSAGYRVATPLAAKGDERGPEEPEKAEDPSARVREQLEQHMEESSEDETDTQDKQT